MVGLDEVLKESSQLQILSVAAVVRTCAIAVGRIGSVEALAHGGHCIFHFRINAGGGSREHGGAQRAGLVGSMDAQRHIEDIGHHLHDEGGFFGYAAQTDEASYRDAFADETVYDGLCAETR